PERDGWHDAVQSAAAGCLALGALQKEERGHGNFHGFPLQEMNGEHGGDAEQGEKSEWICKGGHQRCRTTRWLLKGVPPQSGMMRSWPKGAKVPSTSAASG